jgi:hypothetical protein
MKKKLFAGAVAVGAALGGLGMTGTASALGRPTHAPIPVAHCNVIVYDGWSPCINPNPVLNPGGVMIPYSASMTV